jgi:hypothetical protein
LRGRSDVYGWLEVAMAQWVLRLLTALACYTSSPPSVNKPCAAWHNCHKPSALSGNVAEVLTSDLGESPTSLLQHFPQSLQANATTVSLHVFPNHTSAYRRRAAPPPPTIQLPPLASPSIEPTSAEGQVSAAWDPSQHESCCRLSNTVPVARQPSANWFLQ